jgi:nucleotide-binding universal stress UspA family protein
MYKRILVGVDGTSFRGLDEALRVAKLAGGALMVVHVVNEAMAADYVPAMYLDEVIKAAREAGEQVIQQAVTRARQSDVPCEHKLLETFGGRAADQIVREARSWPADLIVMGTHGRRGLKRLALGSDAELVVRMSPVPVLLVRDEPEPPPRDAASRA